jgi:hypothetical protein
MNINFKVSKLGGFQSWSIVYFGINILFLSISSIIQNVDLDPNKIQDDFQYPKELRPMPQDQNV